MRYIVAIWMGCSFFTQQISAGEGMWIPLWLDSINYSDMYKKGLRLQANDIYNDTATSLKDAVVIFGGGCTGEVISANGLVLTNHHCAYSRIQSHSSIDNDLLEKGFWAGSQSDELPNPGLTVSFLVRMEEVTGRILKNIPDTLPEHKRKIIIDERSAWLVYETVRNTHYQAEVKPLFFGAKYVLFVYEVFRDVRLVGTPPESMGRFGGDTDNWIWPRHTGDFCLFRIYADKSNNPATYSPDNVPFQPKKYLPIATGGVQEGDFTMVMGYPGKTDSYLTAKGLELVALQSLPAKISMREQRLQALQSLMEEGPEQRLRFASRYASSSNAWKKWKGVTQGIVRSQAIEQKKAGERLFFEWAAGSPIYSDLANQFNAFYAEFEPHYQANDLGNELMASIEVFDLIGEYHSAFSGARDSSAEFRSASLKDMNNKGVRYFRSRLVDLDTRILSEQLRLYASNTPVSFQPEWMRNAMLTNQSERHHGTGNLLQSSLFSDSISFLAWARKSFHRQEKLFRSDPLVRAYADWVKLFYGQIYPQTDSLNVELNRLMRLYMSGLMAMYPERPYYPDANFTMRISYGQVEGYTPADAMNLGCQTFLEGVFEKEQLGMADYVVSSPLRQKYLDRDFGNWDADGKMPVCFIGSNHTSGGNSGSPVIDAYGRLVGINFDRNWEGTVSDYAYNPEICRNISLDIRFVLFVIDKVANADWLLDELELIQ